MAVKEDWGPGEQHLEQRESGAELVDEEGRGRDRRQFRGEEGDLEDEMKLSEDSAQDGEAAQDGWRDECVATDSDVEGAFFGREG